MDFMTLRAHAGHKIECVVYGDDEEVSIECADCFEVLCTIPKENVDAE